MNTTCTIEPRTINAKTTRRAADEMLKDLAFVLKMTRRVKDEMVAEGVVAKVGLEPTRLLGDRF